jgi:hypothetical protein
VTKIKNPRWRNKRAKNASNLGKLDKYGYFQALIVENLHGILPRFWFYLKKIIFINVIQGFSVFFLLLYLEIFSSNVSSYSTTWAFMLPNPMLIITKEDLFVNILSPRWLFISNYFLRMDLSEAVDKYLGVEV